MKYEDCKTYTDELFKCFSPLITLKLERATKCKADKEVSK